MIIELSEKEWIEVIKLVDSKATGSYMVGDQNQYDDLKTKMLFQFGMQKGKKK
jgi:hypothetical protein